MSASHEQTATMLDRLDELDRKRLMQAMQTIRAVLEREPGELVLRDPWDGRWFASVWPSRVNPDIP
jgi:hypothetical protein